MKTDMRGLVVSEKRVGESDRLITVLTAERGIIRAFVRSSRRLGGARLSATRLFTYSRLTVFESRDSFVIDDAQTIEVFFELRKDLTRLSLAQYFCELSAALAPQDAEAEEYLRLLLNAMSFLCRGTRSGLTLKAALEMRMMSLSGYMPDLVCCAKCGCYEADAMFFLPRSGRLLCENCVGQEQGDEPALLLHRGAVTALRHTIYADFEKLFAFRVSPETERELSDASERYVLETLQHGFETLDFYHQIA